MPQVPQYRSQVRTQAIQTGRVAVEAPIEAFGGGESAARVTDSLHQFNAQQQGILAEEKRKADDARVNEAYTNLVRTKQDLTWNPKTGALTKQGSDAFGIMDEYIPKFDDAANEIEQGLTNNEQRAAFRAMRMREATDLTGQLERHVYGEGEKYAAEQTAALNSVMQDEAIKNWYVPGKVNSSIGVIKNNISRFAADKGKSPEWVNEQTTRAVSDTHKGVIQNILAGGQDLQAKQYYNKYKDQLDGKDQAQVKSWLEEGSRRGVAERVSQDLINQDLTLAEAREKIDKIGDVETRDEAWRRYRNRVSEREENKQQIYNANLDKASNILEQTRDINMIPPDVWTAMDAKAHRSLEERQRQLAEGIEPVTDWNVYYGMTSMAINKPNDFRKLNLNTIRPYLSNTEFKEISKLQVKIDQGEDIYELQSRSAVRDATLKEFGVDTSPKTVKAQTALNNIRAAVDQEVAAITADTGKKPTNEEIRGITNRLMTTVITDKGLIFNSKKKVYELQPGQKVELRAKDIPAFERQKIEASLKRKGIPITDDAVKDLYQRKLGAIRANQ